MSETIQRTIYLSKGSCSYDHNELMAMCANFAARNALQDVTGVLVRIGNYFIQVLEGDPDTLAELLVKIEQDNRHANFTILTQHDDEKRVFSQWSMNLVDLESTFYVNLKETAELREQIEDIVAGSTDTKRTILGLLTQITRHVRSAAPRQVARN